MALATYPSPSAPLIRFQLPERRRSVSVAERAQRFASSSQPATRADLARYIEARLSR